ncbi:MAG: FliA/WhiG family RNA polymerase sigma factor [Bryobacteraceae bacterium]|jgi:RNA polymerase sigma factor for flagellar operon FliA
MREQLECTGRQATNWREVRDQVVIGNLALVRIIAIRVHENLPVHVDLEDLIHAGVLGLIDAAQKYDVSRNASFQSYAKHRIKGAILDSLRQLDWASRDLRKRQKQAEEAARQLSGRLGRAPNENEVAQEMGVSVERWRRMSMELRNTGLAPSSSSNSDRARDLAEEFPAAPDLRPDRMCERAQLRTTLERAIGTLPKRYQKVVFLYYTNDMTMKEIGDVLGVNESRVSQIHKTALRKMAVALESEGIRSPAAF